MNDVGKSLIIIGAVIIVVGLLLWSGVGKNWIGKLPGDIQFKSGNFSFYFPVVTFLLLSLLLTLIFGIFRK